MFVIVVIVDGSLPIAALDGFGVILRRIQVIVLIVILGQQIYGPEAQTQGQNGCYSNKEQQKKIAAFWHHHSRLPIVNPLTIHLCSSK